MLTDNPAGLPRATAPVFRSSIGRMWTWLARPPLWVTLAACAAILAARKPDAVTHPQFWAEDGPLFYLQALTLGPRAFLEVYASYLHTLPRIIGVIATVVDPRWAPATFVGAAFGITLYTAARTQSPRCPLPRHAGCALAVGLVPDAFETLLNVTNLQWVTAAALLLVLISADPRQ